MREMLILTIADERGSLMNITGPDGSGLKQSAWRECIIVACCQHGRFMFHVCWQAGADQIQYVSDCFIMMKHGGGIARQRTRIIVVPRRGLSNWRLGID